MEVNTMTDHAGSVNAVVATTNSEKQLQHQMTKYSIYGIQKNGRVRDRRLVELFDAVTALLMTPVADK